MTLLEGKPHDQKNLNQDIVNDIEVTHEEKDEFTEVFNFVFKDMKCTVV
jgi:hypothetical protein